MLVSVSTGAGRGTVMNLNKLLTALANAKHPARNQPVG